MKRRRKAATAAKTQTVAQGLPPALRQGERIGIVAPASPVDPERLQAGIESLRKRGFVVEVGEHVFGSSTLFSGTDFERATDIIRMLQDPGIAAVFCARGGYGSQRLLPMIAQAIRRTQPKVLVGYSDITALHSMLQKAGWISWHGPMPGDWPRMTDNDFSVQLLFDLVSGKVSGELPTPAGSSPQAMHPGKATGPLVGGNLSLVAALLGTPYDVDTRGAILFLEDVGEAPYRIDRMLSSMHLAGKFDQVNGVLLGDFTDCHPTSAAPSVTVQDVLRSHFAHLGVPVLWNYPAGHGPVNIPLPIGHQVELDADRCCVRLMGTPVAVR